AVYPRYFFEALGHQAIGWATFGLDYTGYSNAPLGAPKVTKELVAEYALNYELISPISREVALLNFEGKAQAVAEEKNRPSQTLDFGPWTATVSYGLPQFGSGDKPPGNPEPAGRALIARLGDNQFLVTGFFCRVDFRATDASSGRQRRFLRVEEGTYESGKFHPSRIWNGYQTDWGLNFTSAPQVLRVSLDTY
ncbi:MAG: DUF5597 domain-containing protein, partial [Blastocatellia bacterium]